MIRLNSLCAIMFTQSEILAIVLVCVALAIMVALNCVLVYFFRKRRERKLCTHQLQQKREELLNILDDMRAGKYAFDENGEIAEEIAEAEEAEGISEEVDDDDDEEEEEPAPVVNELPLPEAEDTAVYEILAVRDMTEAMRAKFGFVGAEYARKQYYVRYRYGFDAKLREASPEVQQRYTAIADEAALYKGVKLKPSFNQQRICKGNKTLGLILFKGKTLCVAFALNPADYEQTKYRGIDKSDSKRFAKTPMLLKLTSQRRVEYAKYLLLQLADIYTIVMNGQPVKGEYDFSKKTNGELFGENSLRIQIMGEAPDLDGELSEQKAEDLTEPAVIAEPPAEEIATAEEVEEEPVAEVEEAVAEEISEPAEEPVSEPEEADVSEPEEEISEEIEEEDEEYAEEEETEAVQIAGVQGIVVRYNRSFTARITQADDLLKKWYSEIKNYILSYDKVRNRISWKKETFGRGRKTFACLTVRGKSLCLSLATDPKQFEGTKYKVADMSVRSPNSKQPCMYRIKNERRVKYAKQLIAMLMEDDGVSAPQTIAEEDYTLPYRTTEELIEAGLIKVIDSETNFAREPEIAEEQPAEAVAEEIAVAEVEEIPEPAEEPAETEEVEPVSEVEEAVAEEISEPVEEPVEIEEVEPVSEPEEPAEIEEAEPVPEPEEEIEEEDELPERDFEILKEVDVESADIMSDDVARQIIEEKIVKVKKPAGKKKGIVNIDSLSRNFSAGERVTIEVLKEKRLVPREVNYIKVLAKGTLNVPLIVEADDFSLQAVKMLALTGGRAICRKIK